MAGVQVHNTHTRQWESVWVGRQVGKGRQRQVRQVAGIQGGAGHTRAATGIQPQGTRVGRAHTHKG